MSTVNVADLVRLADLDSASLHVYDVLGAPAAVLEVVAQSSGFNWDLRIRPGFVDGLEYAPYLVVETKMSPDWPSKAGTGPVVPPTTLHKPITHFGTKGIEVIGGNKSQKIDYPQAG
ncbi:MAG TPA: hypothetical protein VGP73_02945 [Thermoanaerobaculia bacterium]